MIKPKNNTCSSQPAPLFSLLPIRLQEESLIIRTDQIS